MSGRGSWPWAVGRGPWFVGRGSWAVGRGPWASGLGSWVLVFGLGSPVLVRVTSTVGGPTSASLE
ncbi:hypothetical protein DEJ27_12555 [Curtobacterium sp. MCPF17_018]|nr:hypothetical protein DEJ27_12555 [Curtobacterium sp. MCPF17_018]